MATFDFQTSGLPITNRQHRLQVTSTRSGVKNADIQLRLSTKSGDITIKLDNDGTFDLPIRNDLLNDDPFVIANQPKGTLEIKAFASFAHERAIRWKVGNFAADGKEPLSVVRDGDRAKMHYSPMFEPAASASSTTGPTVACSHQTFPDLPPCKVVKFSFKGSQGNALVIHSERGERSITSDSEGVFVIPYDPDLFQENPWMSWPIPTEEQQPMP